MTWIRAVRDWEGYNPGKNYVDSKLYKLIHSNFHLSDRPPLPLFNVVSDIMSFDNKAITICI